MGKSRTSYKPKQRTKEQITVWAEARQRCEAGETQYRVARDLKLYASTVFQRATRERWAVPTKVRDAAEKLSAVQTSAGVPVWRDAGALGAAVRNTLQLARLPTLLVPDATIDKFLKGQLSNAELFTKLKPLLAPDSEKTNAVPAQTAQIHSDSIQLFDENEAELAEPPTQRLTLTFTQGPEPNSNTNTQLITPNSKNPGKKNGGRELAPSEGDPSAWEREREPIRQALAKELQRVATFFPSCKTIADVKAALQIHRDLHGKLEQSAGTTNITLHLGALKTVPREKFVRGRVADAVPRRNAC